MTLTRDSRKIALLILAGLAVLLSCGPPVQPITTKLVYDVTRVFSAGCGQNALCRDYQGTGIFATDQAACPITCANNSCSTQTKTFVFDNSSWMSVVITTQIIMPPHQVVVTLSQTDAQSQPVQNPWTITLIPNGPTDTWPLMFRVQPQASSDLKIAPGAAIAGHYTLSVLGGYQASSATIEIHAEKDVTTTPPNTTPSFLCSLSD